MSKTLIALFIIIIFIALAIFGISYWTNVPMAELHTQDWACRRAAPEYLESADSLVENWDRVFGIANQTPRIALAGPLRDLADARDEWNDLEHPDCAKEHHETVGDYMQLSLSGMSEFAQQDEDAASDYFETAYSQVLVAAIKRIALERDAGLIEVESEE